MSAASPVPSGSSTSTPLVSGFLAREDRAADVAGALEAQLLVEDQHGFAPQRLARQVVAGAEQVGGEPAYAVGAERSDHA